MNPMKATPSSARTPSSTSTRVSRSDMSMASTVPPGAGEGDPRDCVGGFCPAGGRPPTHVRRGADLRSAVGVRHQDRAVHLLHRAKTPITIAELAKAHLVHALVDLHSADWASLGLASYGTPPAAPALRLAAARSAG